MSLCWGSAAIGGFAGAVATIAIEAAIFVYVVRSNTYVFGKPKRSNRWWRS